MRKAIFMATVALSVTASLALAQDGAKFNGTWKGEGAGQVRTLTYKDGVIHMEEKQADGRIILRDYPTQGQEITMTEGVWKDAKATGKMEGNKLVVDTEQANGTKWHDEWTLADDGKSYSALRQRVQAGRGGGGRGPGGGGAPGGGGGAPGGGGRAGGPAAPETFTKIN